MSKKKRHLRDRKGRFRGSIAANPTPPVAAPVMNQAHNDDLEGISRDVQAVAALYRTQEASPWHHPAVRRIINEVAGDLGTSEESVAHALQAWATADEWDFEDKAAPVQEFQYELRDGVPEDTYIRRSLRKLGYEVFLSQRHPVFVYGTLRRGHGNSGLIDPAREQTIATSLPGASMYTKHWGFPYAKEDSPESEIRGELVWLDGSDMESEVRRSLDYLEGFDSDWPSTSHYERVERTVPYTDPHTGKRCETRAWVYFAQGHAKASLRESDRIESGDWAEANARRAR